MWKLWLLQSSPLTENSSSNLRKARTTRIIEGKDRGTLSASQLLFSMYAPQHYCSSTTPWPLEWFSISTDELDNPQSQLDILRTLGIHYFHTLRMQHVRSVWNILPQHRDTEHWCTCEISGGKANRCATMPILPSILKGPMYFGANFTFLTKPHHAFHRWHF